MADDDLTTLGSGRFSVLRPMATPGTEARAFLCRDSLLTDEVVCRVATGDNASEAFRMQFELLVNVSMPTLVQPLGLFFDEDLDKPFIELEHVAGVALSDWSASAVLTDNLGIHDGGMLAGVGRAAVGHLAHERGVREQLAQAGLLPAAALAAAALRATASLF